MPVQNTAPLLMPGFADPVAGSQYVFRQVLDAMSRPGKIVEIEMDITGPDTLDLAATATLLALVDFETPLYLAPSLRNAAAESYLKFHCGTHIADAPLEAGFAVLDAVPTALDSFDIGTNEYPETGATLILQVETIEAGGSLELSGPGVNGTTRIGLPDVPPSFWEARAALGRHFPRGLDLIFVSGARLAAIPRTTSVTQAKE